jgi:hypothetical protein
LSERHRHRGQYSEQAAILPNLYLCAVEFLSRGCHALASGIPVAKVRRKGEESR